WLILPDQRPRSLGLIQPGQPIRLTIPPDLAGRLTPDAALAVSLEPPGGSPTGQPTGPVIASGKLTSLSADGPLTLAHPPSLPAIARRDARKRAYDPAIHRLREEDGCAGQARA